MVIVDTGFWLALADRSDRLHRRAQARFSSIKEPLISTWPVLTETCYLLASRLGVISRQAFIRSYAEGAFELFDLRRDHAPRIAALMAKYADLPMDLADASLVVLAEQLGHGRILSTDRRDFRSYRWKQREPFENLLLEP